MGVCCVRFPGGVCVREDGSDVLFVYLSDVFFGVTERCICKCSEDVQTFFCLCCDLLYVLSERHSSVTSSVVGQLVYGICSPFSMTEGCSVYSRFHGLMSVSVDFDVETFSLFVWTHFSSMYMYSSRCGAAILESGCCENTVMSAYESMRVSGCVVDVVHVKVE